MVVEDVLQLAMMLPLSSSNLPHLLRLAGHEMHLAAWTRVGGCRGGSPEGGLPGRLDYGRRSSGDGHLLGP